MTRFGFIVQLFMIAACLVPFTSTRQVGALLALAPTAPAQNAPAPQEDDTERTEQNGREKDRSLRLRLDSRSGSNHRLLAVPPVHGSSPRLKPVAGLAPVDHFRNGLGSPYLC
jgi:hypothetical protein